MKREDEPLLSVALWAREVALGAQLVSLWGYSLTGDMQWLEAQAVCGMGRLVTNFAAHALAEPAQDYGGLAPVSIVADLGWLVATSIYISEVLQDAEGLSDAVVIAYPVLMTVISLFSGLRGLQEEG